MQNSYVISPTARGSGAYVMHKLLASRLPGYRVKSYHPYWCLCPAALPLVISLEGARVIHCAADYGIFFWRNSVPLVVTLHNYVLDPWMRAHSSWPQILYYTTALRLWTRLSLQKARIVTAVSYFTAQLVQEDLRTALPIKVIYNGVDDRHFTPQYDTQTSHKHIRVLFSGNLTRRKGVHWLPSIARQVKKNVRIFYTQGLMAGQNLPAVPSLEPIGRINIEDMPRLYRQMDILLMPAVREGFGLAVAEAMACGLPVVASNCSSIPELVDDGRGGFLCPVGDVDQFAEKINILADSAKLRREMGEYNRAKVEKMFSANRMVAEYQTLFESIGG